MEYKVKNGETITDVVLNTNGSLDNWSAIIDANSFKTWTPDLEVGQVIYIPDSVVIQPNNKAVLDIYPANNGSVPDFDDQVDAIINQLKELDWILLTDGTDTIRKGVVDDGGVLSFKVDAVINSIPGFGGVEDTDWTNILTVTISGATEYRDGFADGHYVVEGLVGGAWIRS